MKYRYQKTMGIVVLSILLLSTLGGAVALADEPHHLATYRVTVYNLTPGQPLTPPLTATHSNSVKMFQAGKLASPEL